MAGGDHGCFYVREEVKREEVRKAGVEEKVRRGSERSEN